MRQRPWKDLQRSLKTFPRFDAGTEVDGRFGAGTKSDGRFRAGTEVWWLSQGPL